MAVILGIESTCDETAAAVVVDGRVVRSSVIATQFELHAKYRGVVPEIASRAHIENILPVIRESMQQAGMAGSFDGIDAVAIAHRPGLIGSLLIGVTAAKALAWSIGRPLVGVDHVQAHLYSVMLDKTESPPMPAVGLVVSGGHTALYHIRSWLDIELIGSTIDDAVGEAYDKVAAILNLGFPGGPIIDKLAQQGDPKAVKLPRTLLGRESLDFSFSGLKTAVLYHVRGVPTKESPLSARPVEPLTEQQTRDIAASFQSACVDVLIEKLRRACREVGAKSVIVGGGVCANSGLRSALERFELPVFMPHLRYCTDNAAMSGGLGHVMFDAGRISPLDLDAIPYSVFRK